jgi:NTP pyrophosphatase (non-canonical NTP hydrolase)
MSQTTNTNGLQAAARQFQEEYGFKLTPELACLDLVAEVGELAKEVLLRTDYGTHPPANPPNLEAELGDACYALAALANGLGMDLDAALAGRLAAYSVRFAGRRVADHPEDDE